MEVYEPLPPSLESSRKDALGPSTRAHLEYLWKAAHAVSSSGALAHHLARRFVETADKCGLHYPAEVTRRLCGWCSNILLPSVTCTVRIRPRGRHATRKVQAATAIPGSSASKGNKSKGNSGAPAASVPAHQRFRKLKNTVVTQCSMCHHVTSVLAGYPRTPKAPKVAADPVAAAGESGDASETASGGQGAAATGSSAAPPAGEAKFSFLKKLDKKASVLGTLAGDFIPLGGGTSTSSSSSSSSSRGNGPPPPAVAVGGKRSLTLAELERQSKKDKQKKRKTVPPQLPAQRPGQLPSASATGGGTASLSSLQSFFKK